MRVIIFYLQQIGSEPWRGSRIFLAGDELTDAILVLLFLMRFFSILLFRSFPMEIDQSTL